MKLVEWTAPERPREVPIRPEPIENELFLSYLGRTASANRVRRVDLFPMLGLPTRVPNWFGVDAPPGAIELWSQVLRLSEGEIENLHFEEDAHPDRQGFKRMLVGRARFCPTCLATDGAWRRAWTDPLIFICEIHHTLLIDPDPHVLIAKVGDVDLGPLMAANPGAPHEPFTRRQQHITELRNKWDYRPLLFGSGKYLPETVALEALTMIRLSIELAPSSESLVSWIEEDAVIVEDGLSRPFPTPPYQDARASIHGPVEIVAAASGVLLDVIHEGAAFSARETLDDLLDDLFVTHRERVQTVRRTVQQYAYGWMIH